MTARLSLLPGRSPVLLLAGMAALLLAGCGHGSHEPDTSTWRGVVAPGGWLRIRNVNGPVRVARASGHEVVVTATRRYHGRRPEPVRMLTESSGNDVTVCAVWGGGSSCSSRSRDRGNFLLRLLRRTSSTEMDFVVVLPAGVRLDAATVNGRVTVADAAGEVSAKTVNGSATVAATVGPVRATTVNGSVSARLDSLAPGARVALETVNGSVTAMLPPSLSATLDLATTNGRIATDLPAVTVPRNARSVRATLGAGGNRVSLKTVNGSVRLEALR